MTQRIAPFFLRPVRSGDIHCQGRAQPARHPGPCRWRYAASCFSRLVGLTGREKQPGAGRPVRGRGEAPPLPSSWAATAGPSDSCRPAPVCVNTTSPMPARYSLSPWQLPRPMREASSCRARCTATSLASSSSRNCLCGNACASASMRSATQPRRPCTCWPTRCSAG